MTNDELSEDQIQLLREYGSARRMVNAVADVMNINVDDDEDQKTMLHFLKEEHRILRELGVLDE